MAHFKTSEECWFWYMRVLAQFNDALPMAIETETGPLDPGIISRALEQLYKSRRLSLNHLRVLRFYGERQKAPRPFIKSEEDVFILWRQALNALAEPLRNQGVLAEQPVNITAVNFKKKEA